MGFHNSPSPPLDQQADRFTLLAAEITYAADTLRRTASSQHPKFPEDTCERRRLRLKEIRSHRIARGRFFDSQLFGDPAWDILLYAMQSELEQRRVKVSDMCLKSNVPPTTGLRWIKVLERSGMLVRSSHPTDKRTFYVALSPEGRAKMNEYLDAVSGQPLVGERTG